RRLPPCSFFCLFRDRPTTEIYPLSLHDALPISGSSADHGASPDLPKTVPIPPTSRGFGLLFPKNPEISMKSHRTLRRALAVGLADRKSTRLNSSHVKISYAVFCLKKKNKTTQDK